jgi:hypothetical protein
MASCITMDPQQALDEPAPPDVTATARESGYPSAEVLLDREVQGLYDEEPEFFGVVVFVLGPSLGGACPFTGLPCPGTFMG